MRYCDDSHLSTYYVSSYFHVEINLKIDIPLDMALEQFTTIYRILVNAGFNHNNSSIGGMVFIRIIKNNTMCDVTC